MRFVIFGAGAIGGVVGAGLYRAGREVMLIARGAHHDAIAAHGLTLRTPDETVTLPIPVAPDPSAAGVRAGDVVLLCTKGQDTWPALLALRDAAARAGGVPVACLQNGVENERVALRLFDDVLGAVVMAPTAHLEPGTVLAYGSARLGAIDLGRYPSGADALCDEIAAALDAAGFDSTPREDIMRHKFAKLINNLANSVQAVCGPDADSHALIERIQEEGRTVLRAEGIAFEVADVADLSGRWQRWAVRDIAGHPRQGGSTWQSVSRGTPVETDYLNGEIVLRGRRLGIATPANRLMQELAQETVRDGHRPGWRSSAGILARLERPAATSG